MQMNLMHCFPKLMYKKPAFYPTAYRFEPSLMGSNSESSLSLPESTNHQVKEAGGGLYSPSYMH